MNLEDVENRMGHILCNFLQTYDKVFDGPKIFFSDADGTEMDTTVVSVDGNQVGADFWIRKWDEQIYAHFLKIQNYFFSSFCHDFLTSSI